MSDCRVYVVLATYQGETYLPGLLSSIRAQSHPAWTLLARDDKSSDATPLILREAAAVDPRIVLMEDDDARLGAAGNFGRLLHETLRQGADYIFPADQDDVWHADKIAEQVRALQTAEAASGAAVPQLAFCDAAVVDAQGRPLHASFLRQNRLPYQSQHPLATLLGRCFVLGCMCAVNRALLELALPLPAAIASHDWWLALCAAAAGRITCIDAPLLSYRRHGANASQPAIWNVLNRRDGWRQRWTIGWESFMRSLDQARGLRARLVERNIATGEEVQMLAAFCRILDEPNRWRRLRQLHQLGVPQIGGLRRLLYDACMLIR